MENQPENRVERALLQWKAQEERLSKLFLADFSDNKGLLKIKLLHFEGIATRYKESRSFVEQLTLQGIFDSITKLEKQLYPNPVKRFFRKYFVKPDLERKAANSNRLQILKAQQVLSTKLYQLGFKGFERALADHLKKDHTQFSIPMSYYINSGERMDHELVFSKNHSGQYVFEGFMVGLIHENNPEENRQQYFESDGINLAEACNLLAGRAIYKDGQWQQFDLNDKNAEGNYFMKVFPAEFGYDLNMVLKDLPLIDRHQLVHGQTIQQRLKTGERVAVTFKLSDGSEKSCFIEANPQFKTLNVFDQNQRKITLDTALGRNKSIEMTPKVAVELQQKQQKRNGIKR